MELKELKKDYASAAGKYKLPSFEKLNEDFEIDKIEKETDFILRAIRKAVMEKVVNSLGFVEMLLNPSNAPRLYLGYIQTMTVSDREKINNIYETLADLSLSSLALEIDSNEKKEAELIAKTYEKWSLIKPDFKGIIESVKNPKATIAKKEKSYYG